MKLTLANYNPDTKVSYVCVKHLGRYFEAFSHLHPDDADKESRFAGCHYAEDRAEIKALKYELKLKKEECDNYRNFVKACECYKNWDKESPTAKVVYRQLNRRIKEVNDLIDIINSRLDRFDRNIRRHDIVVDALQKKKQNRLNNNK